MDAKQTTVDTVGLSPLDQIRQAEAKVTRRIAAARQAAEVAVQKAQAQAVSLKRKARETGCCEGQAQYREIVSRAEEEARVLIAQAHSQAQILRQKGDLCLDAAVRLAVEIVIGQEAEAGSA